METTSNYNGLMALGFTFVILVGIPLLAVLYYNILDHIERLTSVKFYIIKLKQDIIWPKKKILELREANLLHKNHISEYGHIIDLIEGMPTNTLIVILNRKKLYEKVKFYSKELNKITTDLENYNVYTNLKTEVITMIGKLSNRGFGNSIDELSNILVLIEKYEISNYYRYDAMFTKWKNSNHIQLQWITETNKYAGVLDNYRRYCTTNDEKKLLEGIFYRIYPTERNYYDDMDTEKMSLENIRAEFYGIVEHFEKEIERENVISSIMKWINEYPSTLKGIENNMREIIRISEKIEYICMATEVRRYFAILKTNYDFIMGRYYTPKAISMYYPTIIDIISTIYEYSEHINIKYRESIAIEYEYDNSDKIRDCIWSQIMDLMADTENDDPIIQNKAKVLVNDHLEKRSGIALVYQNQRSLKTINNILHQRNKKKSENINIEETVCR